jgi:zinc protease
VTVIEVIMIGLIVVLINSAVAEEGQEPTEEVVLEQKENEQKPLMVEEKFVHETLDNGMQISVYSNPDYTLVATQIWVSVGGAQETEEERGFAHLFEHLMFGKTKNNTKETYNRHHVLYGGSENAYTAFDNTVYISEIPPSGHSQVLQLEADRFGNLILDQEALENEKKIVTEELRLRGENDPTARLMTSTLANFFGEHPYSKSPAGTKEDIQNADLELCQKFYHGYYTPQNLHLVIVGPVHAETTLAQAKELFSQLENDESAITPPEVPTFEQWEFPPSVELTDDIPPIKIAAHVYTLPTVVDPDYYALQVLSQMLSGSETDLFREDLVTQRKKAVEGMSIYIDDFKAGGLMIFASISLPTRSKRRAYKLIGSSVDNLDEKDWMTEENLNAAKKYLLRQEMEKRWYSAEMADSIGWYADRMGDPKQGLEGGQAELEQVTLDDIQRVWKTYIMDKQPIEVFFKKGKPQQTQLEVTQGGDQ